MRTSRSQPAPEASADARDETTRDDWLRCAACEARVTRASARIVVNGAHERELMNPSGLRFRVGCYQTAPGCEPDGERSSVWTWFPGHDWQIERCGRCHTHLGWSFHGASSFYGLVQDRLAEGRRS